MSLCVHLFHGFCFQHILLHWFAFGYGGQGVLLKLLPLLSLRRPGQYSQALACQPLRRHMSTFVKHYRPMNMAERQRRHDIKDLEAQVSKTRPSGSLLLFLSNYTHGMIRDRTELGAAPLSAQPVVCIPVYPPASDARVVKLFPHMIKARFVTKQRK